MDIRQKIVSGQINRQALESEMKQRRQAQRNLLVLKQKNISPVGYWRNEHKFYTNMDDLRHKIRTGEIPRSKGPKRSATISEKLFPAFVSTKSFDATYLKKASKSSTSSQSNFQPPLLPLDSQSPPNSFFAGQNSHYTLPTPLPMNEIYLNAIRSQQGSISNSNSSSRIGTLSNVGSRQGTICLREPSRAQTVDNL